MTANEAFSGSYSLRVGFVNSNTSQGGRVQVVSGVAGATYVLSASAKIGSGADDGCYIGIEFKDASGRSLDEKAAHVTATSWTSHSVTALAPSSTALVRAFVWKDAGSNSCYVDAFSLIKK